jgi:uncharacterized membrane protein required for colicin V production
MSGLDVGLILLAAVGAVAGMKIGAVSALFNVLAGLVGSGVAARLHLTAAVSLGLSASAAYLTLFLFSAGVLVAAGILLSRALEAHFLGLADKFVGALLGVALSLVLASSALVPALLSESPAVQDMMRRSAFAPYLLRRAQARFRLAPDALWDRVTPVLESDRLRRVRELLERSR